MPDQHLRQRMAYVMDQFDRLRRLTMIGARLDPMNKEDAADLTRLLDQLEKEVKEVKAKYSLAKRISGPGPMIIEGEIVVFRRTRRGRKRNG